MFVEIPGNIVVFREGDELYLFPEAHLADLEILESNRFAIIKKGITCGTIRGNDFKPNHHLAMSLLKKNTVCTGQINNSDEIINYLRGNDLQTFFEIGWRLIMFNAQFLGWFKQIKSRGNNYYPKHLRIKQ